MMRRRSRSRFVPTIGAVSVLAVRGPIALACLRAAPSTARPRRRPTPARRSDPAGRAPGVAPASGPARRRQAAPGALAGPTPPLLGSRAASVRPVPALSLRAGRHASGHSLVLPPAAAQGLGSVARGRRGRLSARRSATARGPASYAPPPPEDAILIATIRAMSHAAALAPAPGGAQGIRAGRRRPARGAGRLRVRRRRLPEAARGAAEEREHHPDVERAGRAHSDDQLPPRRHSGASARRRGDWMPYSPSRRCAKH